MFFARLVYFLGIIAIAILMGIYESYWQVGFIIFLVWSVVGGAILFIKWAKNLPDPKTAHVKVISKTIKPVYATTLYYISFEFSDGTRENFMVDVNQYNNILENEIGTLTYTELEKVSHIKGEGRKKEYTFIDFKLSK